MDLRPLNPAEDRRTEECGVRVCGLKLDLFRCMLVPPSPEPWVSILGLGGSVALVCNSGLVPMFAFLCCVVGIGPVEVRFRSLKISCSVLSGPLGIS